MNCYGAVSPPRLTLAFARVGALLLVLFSNCSAVGATTPPNVPTAPTAPVISYAEKPLRLIRATALYNVTPGVMLQAGDIIESGPAGAQIEGLAATTIAIGPDTKIYVGRSGSSTELDLLTGWLKIQPQSPAAPSTLTIAALALRIDVAGGTSVVHAAADRVEVFIESGKQTVAELDKRGQPARPQQLMREQYALRLPDQPLQLAGRPAKEFVASMPKQFFDPLVPVAYKLGAPPPLTKEREVAYDDIAPWLLGFADKKILVARFAARLSDPVFHKRLADDLGRSAEWKPVLEREDRKKSAVRNNLF